VKLFPIFFFLSFLRGDIHAQDTTLLRLRALADDTAKANRLIQWGRNYLDKDNKKAQAVLAEALSLSERLHYSAGMASAHRRLGYIHGQEGRYQEAIASYRKAIVYYREEQADADLLICFNNTAANFRQLGKVDSAIHFYLLGIRKVESFQPEKVLPAIWKDMQVTYALLNSNVSGLYGNMGNVPKALQYGRKAIEVATTIKDTVRMVLSMVSISHAYTVSKDFQRAYPYAKEAVRLGALAGEDVPLSKSLHVLSACYRGLHKLDSAVIAARRSMEYAKHSDLQLYITSFLDLADVYHEKKEYRKEESFLLDGLKQFESVDNVSFGRDVYERLAMANYAMANYRLAFDYYSKSTVYKDSMLSRENRTKVAELDAIYQTSLKEMALSQKELQLAKKDLQLHKIRYYMQIVIAALVVALVITVLLLLLFRQKKLAHSRELIAAQKEKEIQLLHALMQGEEKERSRIARELHDGVAGVLAAAKMQFSSMPGSEALMDTEGYQRGMILLNDAMQDIRKTSHNLMPEVLLQHGLDEALRRYCHSAANSKTLRIQYDSWGPVDRYANNFELSVYRIVQELINNIIKHSKATQAIVQMARQGELLTISIEDNGVGFKQDGIIDGMGLRSLQSRLRAINGKIEMQASARSGVSAYLEFDISALKAEIAVV